MSLVSRLLDPAMVERLNLLQLSARSVVEGSTMGLHRASLKGASIEFRQHRAYVPGDEPRRLDWRVLARTDRPFIKQYDEETNLRCVLLLDCSGSMSYTGERSGGISKFEYAARLVTSLAYLMLGQTESVGLALTGKGGTGRGGGVARASPLDQWIHPESGPTQLSRIIDALERATPRHATSIAPAMHDVAERVGRRALIVIVSDLFSPVSSIRAGLAHLRHDRHEVLCLRVLNPDEIDFPFRAWSRFRGLEGERPQLLEPALMRRTYLDNFNRHRRALDDACRSLSVQRFDFPTDRPLIDSLTQMLHQRAARG
jgi:uncharacterized protein (DUF58 family)